MRMAVLFLVAFLLGGDSCHALGEENETPRGVLIPIPEGGEIDEAVLKRLAEKYSDEKQSFLKLLLALEANQIDYSRDSLSDIKQKKTAILQASGQTNSIVASRFSQPDLEIDYVRLCWEVVPRLTPNIVKVGRQEQFTTLRQALPNLRAGDQIELGSGSFTLPLDANWVPPTDISIVGKSRTLTTLKTEGDGSRVVLERWRLADLKIDLGTTNGPSRNTFPGGSLCLAQCTVTGYSSPYGVFGRGKHALIEDCLFDGTANRIGSRIFGISNEWEAIYLRNTTIEEQRMMSHGMPCALILDKCHFKSSQPVILHGSPALVRDTSGLRPLPNLIEFQFATDDEAVVEYALGKRKKVDPRIDRLDEAIKLSRNPFYWIGLLRHRSPEIRVTAAGQIQRLLGQQLAPQVLAPQANPQIDDATDSAIATAIRELKSDEYARRQEARKKLIAIGEPAVHALQAIAKSGTLEQKRSAEVILLQVAGPPGQLPVPREWELEYGRISRWYEENRTRLAWNEVAGRYQ